MFIIDAAALGIRKVLGKGKVSSKFKITVAAASPKAIEAVQQAGGKLQPVLIEELIRAVPAGEVIARLDVLGMNMPCAATIGTKRLRIRLSNKAIGKNFFIIKVPPHFKPSF